MWSVVSLVMGSRFVLLPMILLVVTACSEPGPEPAAEAKPAPSSIPTPPPSAAVPSPPPSTPIASIVDEIADRATLEVPAGFDPRFIGKWKSESWRPSYEIRVVDGEVVVTGQDGPGGERFEVSEVSWTPTTLEATFRIPSIDHRTHAVLRLVDDSRIEERFGGPVGGTDHWRRVVE